MPLPWGFDIDWHHDHLWPWPKFWHWDSDLRCPLRRHHWTANCTEFDVCARDWHIHHAVESPWCHRTCLTSQVYVENGSEKDTNGRGTFKAIIDVHHFRRDELQLKVRNNDTILLEGKQSDDRADKNRVLCVTREFSRKFKLPRNYDATQARAALSSDGILTIMVPAPPPLDDVERTIDIIETGAYFGSNAANNEATATTNAIEAGKTADDEDANKEEQK